MRPESARQLLSAMLFVVVFAATAAMAQPERRHPRLTRPPAAARIAVADIADDDGSDVVAIAQRGHRRLSRNDQRGDLSMLRGRRLHGKAFRIAADGTLLPGVDRRATTDTPLLTGSREAGTRVVAFPGLVRAGPGTPVLLHRPTRDSSCPLRAPLHIPSPDPRASLISSSPRASAVRSADPRFA